ncbi:MAG TPA: HIT family protein [Acidimicrobiales bacterium]|nr:HIT family protein [Acidimicrobiales bacterium]
MIDPACPFCAIATGASDAFVVSETAETIAFLDRRPVFDGHTLLIPRDHHVTLTDLPRDLVAPLFTEAQRLARAMQDGLGADGAFVAMNHVVSQSVAHVHVHVVPRRFKDGLRGFFWPRTKYRDDAHADEVASRLRVVLTPRS